MRIDVFFSCEVIDLTNEALKVRWDRDVTFWVRRSDMDELSDLDHLGDKGKLVMRDGWHGRDSVLQLFADVPARREEETK